MSSAPIANPINDKKPIPITRNKFSRSLHGGKVKKGNKKPHGKKTKVVEGKGDSKYQVFNRAPAQSVPFKAK